MTPHPEAVQAAAIWQALKRSINDPESAAVRAALGRLRRGE